MSLVRVQSEEPNLRSLLRKLSRLFVVCRAVVSRGKLVFVRDFPPAHARSQTGPDGGRLLLPSRFATRALIFPASAIELQQPPGIQQHQQGAEIVQYCRHQGSRRAEQPHRRGNYD